MPFFLSSGPAVRLSFLGAFLAALAAPGGAAEPAWEDLFDGRSLHGWRAAEHPDSFQVVDGTITCHGERGHLFYTGDDGAAAFENFELSVEVNAKRGSNSGIYFHTAYQASGFPEAGFEVQVNNSEEQNGDYRENKKTGSLYGIRNIYRAVVPDDTWFTVHVRVQRPRVEVRVNDVLIVDYIEPRFPLPDGAPALNRLGRGMFALQAHDPGSHVSYRNLRVRRLPPGATPGIEPAPLDPAAAQRLAIGKENFPLLDLHTHLKGDLTLADALAISRATGVGLGIATNGGQGFPMQTDKMALAFLQAHRDAPVFLALQAEGREWTGMFSPEVIAQFDYVFSDAMTYGDAQGRRMRLWIPEETFIGPDVDAFMDDLTAQAVAIISNEPIDIYVNPTFLPEAIAGRYDELWTEPRMRRIIDAAAAHDVAIEINARYRIPSERFLRLAHAAGVKFTIGTNNTGSADFGDWSYPMAMQHRLGLTWKDIFVPGHAPTRAQRALATVRH